MKKIKIIKIDADKCTGCRECEMICSAYHAEPQYSSINPRRSRIQVFEDEENGVYIPILAGPYTDVECLGRNIVTINGKEYSECSFCRASCPARGLFTEPDEPEIPLKCDMCGENCGEPELPEPKCVEWCMADCLTYVEREEEE